MTWETSPRLKAMTLEICEISGLFFFSSRIPKSFVVGLLQDIAGSPDGAVLLTVGPCGAKLWTLIRSQE